MASSTSSQPAAELYIRTRYQATGTGKLNNVRTFRTPGVIQQRCAPVYTNSDLVLAEEIHHGIKHILRTSAVSSTNFGSILIFASCVVGTFNILNG